MKSKFATMLSICVLIFLYCFFVFVFFFKDGGGEDDNNQQPQQVASALVNSSPKMPRTEAPSIIQPAQPTRPERFDVTLQRKDNEGFGFVILTSKNKPPPGG